MLLKELKSLIKKGDFKLSESRRTRIRGWNNSSEGYDVSGLYPWRTQYTRNYRRMWSYLDDRTQQVYISYTSGTNHGRVMTPEERNDKMKELLSYLKKNGVKGKIEERGIVVEVENPYSVEEVNRMNARWH